MKVKFNNEDVFRNVGPFAEGAEEIHLWDMPENLNGFVLFEDDEKTVIRDCSGFIYRYNIYDDPETTTLIVYTDNPDCKQSKPDPNETFTEWDPPVNESDLVSAVADLMMEVDMMKMGM